MFGVRCCFFLSLLRGGGTISLVECGVSVFSFEHLLRDGSSCRLKEPSPSGSKRSRFSSAIGKTSGSAAEDCSAWSCTEEFAPSGGFPGHFVQIPFTWAQCVKKSASGSSPTFGKRSGSIVEDCSACQDRPEELAPAGGHPGCFVHIPFVCAHCILAELVAFWSGVSRGIGRSPELASTRETPFLSGGGVSRFCHIPSAEGLSDLL